MQRVNQLPCLGGRIHHIGQLRLYAKVNVVLLGNGNCGLHGVQQVMPGLLGCIVRVPAPLVNRIARARAQCDQPGFHGSTRSCQNRKPRMALVAFSGVGMDHVVGAGHGGNPHTGRFCHHRNG